MANPNINFKMGTRSEFNCNGTAINNGQLSFTVDRVKVAGDAAEALGSLYLDYNGYRVQIANVDKIYPVGSIYMTVNEDIRPDVEFGGTWVQISNYVQFGNDTVYYWKRTE